MRITHTFVNPLPDFPGFTGTKPSDWNADHEVEDLEEQIRVANVVDFGAVAGTDMKTALTAAMAVFDDSGGTVRIPCGTWSLSSNNTIPENVTLVFDPGAVVERLDESQHLFKPAGNNRIIGLTTQGLWNGVTSAVSTAVVAAVGVSNVQVVDADFQDALGDHIRIADSEDIVVDGLKGQAGRNVVTLNDDSGGSSRIKMSRVYVLSYLHGFDAESDDEIPVEDVNIDGFEWTHLGSTSGCGAVLFTKSASPSGSAIKYTKLRLRNIKAIGGEYGIVLRGARDIEIEALVTDGVVRGIDAGTGHHVENLRVISGNIDATFRGISIVSPSGETASSDVAIDNVHMHGFTTSAAVGVYSEATETRVSSQTLVDMAGAASSIGVRLAGHLSRTAATVKDARTAYVQLDGGTDRRIIAVGGIFDATTGSASTDVNITGTSVDAVAEGNYGP